MSSEVLGALGMIVMFVLVILRVPIAVSLGVTGVVGYAILDGWGTAMKVLGRTPFDLSAGYALSVLPLFILMGAVAGHSGMSRELFAAANAFFSGRRGALAMATVGACAAFGTISGSSLANAATMSRIAVPEMMKYGYDPRVACGSVAAGGTLGILIPPSIMFVLYAIAAEQSLAQLYAAGLIPGLVLTALLIGVIWTMGRLRPGWMPVTPSMSWRERVSALADVWKLAILFFLAVIGIYLGLFSPTEAAAVASFGAIVIAVACRQLTWTQFVDSLIETVRTTAMLFFILICAFLFGYFLVRTQLPAGLAEWVKGFDPPGWVVIFFLILIYTILGCVLESISMLLITVPVFLPLIQAFGYDPVWFGVFVVAMIELGLLTPPVGLNVFVIHQQIPEIPLETAFRGVVPFISANAVLVFLLLAFPAIALWFPRFLYG